MPTLQKTWKGDWVHSRIRNLPSSEKLPAGYTIGPLKKERYCSCRLYYCMHGVCTITQLPPNISMHCVHQLPTNINTVCTQLPTNISIHCVHIQPSSLPISIQCVTQFPTNMNTVCTYNPAPYQYQYRNLHLTNVQFFSCFSTKECSFLNRRVAQRMQKGLQATYIARTWLMTVLFHIILYHYNGVTKYKMYTH